MENTLNKVIYCDIDGTLTDEPHHPYGTPLCKSIEAIKLLIEKGAQVILWSATGEEYARQFAEQHNIKAYMCLAKPDFYIDDRKDIRSPRLLHWVPDTGIVTFSERF